MTNIRVKVREFDQWFDSFFDVPHIPSRSNTPKIRERFGELVTEHAKGCEKFHQLVRMSRVKCFVSEQELLMYLYVTVPQETRHCWGYWRGSYEKMLLLQTTARAKNLGLSLKAEDYL